MHSGPFTRTHHFSNANLQRDIRVSARWQMSKHQRISTHPFISTRKHPLIQSSALIHVLVGSKLLQERAELVGDIAQLLAEARQALLQLHARATDAALPHREQLRLASSPPCLAAVRTQRR